MSERQISELNDELALAEAQFEKVTAQIRAVLVTDVEKFATKACKEAFLSNPETARGLKEAARIKGFKEAAQKVGASLASQLSEALAGLSIWREDIGSPEDTRSLESARGVWSAVRGVETDVQALLVEYGFGGESAAYSPPKYFVEGQYLPTLVEHYWRLCGEMQALEARKTGLETETTRKALEEAWNNA